MGFKKTIYLDYIDKILITPVGDKYNKSGLIDSKYRVKMLELVIKDIDKTYIDFTEILADKVLTTDETLQILQNKPNILTNTQMLYKLKENGINIYQNCLN